MILVCHLSQVINADHGLIKTCVVTVRALQQINGFGHLFFLTKVILINGKNSVILALAATITVIKMMGRNHSDVFLTLLKGHLKIPWLSRHQVGGQEKHLVTLEAIILAYATENKCHTDPPFG